MRDQELWYDDVLSLGVTFEVEFKN